VQVSDAPNLTLDHSCVPATLRVGQSSTCRVEATHLGGLPAEDVHVILATASAFSAGAPIGAGWTCTYETQEGPHYDCARAALGNAESASLQYLVTARTDAALNVSHTNWASVGNARGDYDSDDNVAFFSIDVVGPVLTTSVTQTVLLGEPISGAANLTGFTNPTGILTFKLYKRGNTTCSGTTYLFSATRAVNGNGDYESPTFTPTAEGDYRWRISYSGDAVNPPKASSCNANGTLSVVTPHAELSVSKSCGVVAVRPAATVKCTISVTNTGPSPAANVVLIDDVPGGFVERVSQPSGGSFTCVVQADRSAEILCTKAKQGLSKATVTYTMTLYPDLEPDTVITNQATVTSDTAEFALADNLTSSDARTAACTVDRRTSPGGVTVTGTAGVDVLCGSELDDTLDGAGGADLLYGFTGNDTLKGGAGNDLLNGRDGSDTLNGGGGNDTIFASDGDIDFITCGAGTDIVYAHVGFDVISGDCEVVRSF
jgi:uncharacterized repeat protein (TIGR01451 family)